MSEFLQDGVQVRYSPVFGDFSVADSHGVDRFELDGIAGGGDSEKVAKVRTALSGVGVGAHTEALHRFLVDEGVDAVRFNTETDRKRDVARSESVDVAVDPIGCEVTQPTRQTRPVLRRPDPSEASRSTLVSPQVPMTSAPHSRTSWAA